MVPGAGRVGVVLASRSPQRSELLSRIGLEPEVRAPDVEEVGSAGEDPADAVLENARRKAASVRAPGALVIGCDTDVALDGHLLGKPADEDMARGYLERLSGRSHEVLSGLCLLGPEPGRSREGVAVSVVRFRELPEAELSRYLERGEWRDRAGGYAIQGLGSTLVDAIEGDVSNVVGLPLALLLELAPDIYCGGSAA